MYIPSTLIYIVKDGKTLMMHRVKKKGDIHQDKYNGLGGKIEKGESPLECAKREVKEESNLDITNIKPIGQMMFPNFDGLGNDWLVFLYRVDEFKGELTSNCNEGNLRWIKNEEVLKLNLWEGDKIFLPYVYSGTSIDAYFEYKDKKLVNYRVNELA